MWRTMCVVWLVSCVVTGCAADEDDLPSAPAGQGLACVDDLACPLDMRCHEMDDGSRRCRYGWEGDPCTYQGECDFGFYCLETEPGGESLCYDAAPEHGALCNAALPMCPDDHQCRCYQGECRCQDGSEGDRCVEEWMCKDGLVCETDGTDGVGLCAESPAREPWNW